MLRSEGEVRTPGAMRGDRGRASIACAWSYRLEQQVEKQHVVIDMLEHDLSEAQKVLKFPPEWRTLEGVDFAGMVPSGMRIWHIYLAEPD